MIKLTVFITLIIVLCSCDTQPNVSKETIVRTLNEIIASDSLTFKSVFLHLTSLDLPDSLREKFFSNDQAFIRSQQKDTSNLTIGGAVIQTYSRRFKMFKPATIDSSFKNNIYYVFSKPIYSSDGQTVAVSITEVCNCMLGGWGEKIIYRKQNGVWKQVATWDSWIG